MHITCLHCGTQLAVVHEGGAAYTEKLDQLVERTEQIEGKVDAMHREQKIAALDREWQAKQESLKVRSKNGIPHLPSKVKGLVSVVLGVFVGMFIFCLGAGASDTGGPGVIFSVIGAAAILLITGSGFWQYQRAEAYEKAKREYGRQRQQLR
ncbi:hypothetical protein HOV93_02780 [Planctomycetes bacterium FF15]|uniref:Uncharacterized protein n=2 Tax=Bremerella alba TaxID=980252 RepID=A0A7V8V1C7_9BACT|nr:hypothetical protein [Bremerella alba]